MIKVMSRVFKDFVNWFLIFRLKFSEKVNKIISYCFVFTPTSPIIQKWTRKWEIHIYLYEFSTITILSLLYSYPQRLTCDIWIWTRYPHLCESKTASWFVLVADTLGHQTKYSIPSYWRHLIEDIIFIYFFIIVTWFSLLIVCE